MKKSMDNIEEARFVRGDQEQADACLRKEESEHKGVKPAQKKEPPCACMHHGEGSIYTLCKKKVEKNEWKH